MNMNPILTKEELECTVDEWKDPKRFDPTTYASDSSSAQPDPPEDPDQGPEDPDQGPEDPDQGPEDPDQGPEDPNP